MKIKTFRKLFFSIIGIIFCALNLAFHQRLDASQQPNQQMVKTKKVNIINPSEPVQNFNYSNFEIGHDFSGAIITDVNKIDYLYLWGHNKNHKVSKGQNIIEANPVEKVLPESKIKQLALGWNDNAGAITTDQNGIDHLYMWGYDDYGETGRGRGGLIKTYQEIKFSEAKIKDLAIGYDHSAVITTDANNKDHLYLMGSNTYGQIGQQLVEDSYLPKELIFLESKIKDLSLGHHYSGIVATDHDGNDHLYLWGDNRQGQLGNGNTVLQHLPFKVPLEENSIKSLSLNNSHTSVVTTDQDGNDHLYLWGNNFYGQLGNGKTRNQKQPTKVALLENKIKQTSLGYHHSSVITTDQDGNDHLYLWGLNHCGELGDGSTIHQSQPKEVVLEEKRIKQIRLGYHYSGIVATDQDGNDHLYLWGDNRHGQLGNGNIAQQLKPIKRLLLETKIVQTNLGYNHTSVVTTDQVGKNHLYLWGYNRYGQLGNGQTLSQYQPTKVSFPKEQIEKVSLGNFHSSAITIDKNKKNHLYLWGENHYGQLGNGNKINQHQPIKVSLPENTINQANLGHNHSSVVTTDQDGNDHLYLWGDNRHGQLGNGNAINQNKPTKLFLMENKIKEASLGSAHSSVVTTDQDGNDHLYLWGDNRHGQLGISNTNNQNKPIKIFLEEAKIKKISLGHYHSSVITTDQDGNDHLYLWGDNRYGQLGNGKTIEQHLPMKITLVEKHIKEVDLGSAHTSVVTTDQDGNDHLYLWGNNFSGQLGNGNTVNQHLPIKIFLPEQRIKKVALGYKHSSVITTDQDGNDQLYLWGDNEYGKLGILPRNFLTKPSKISTLKKALAVKEWENSQKSFDDKQGGLVWLFLLLLLI